MKRDARIGLAVVLVLGLAVTLLVVRALYNRGQEVASDHETDKPDTAVAIGADAHRVPGADVGGAESAAAQLPAAHPENNNPAVSSFITDETKPAGGGHAAGALGAMAPVTGSEVATLDHEPTAPPSPPPPLKPEAHVDSHTAPVLYAYTPVSGDNLYKISTKIFGDGKYASKIKAANGGNDKVIIGVLLKIPEIQNKSMHLKLPLFGEGAKAKSATAKVLEPETSKAKTAEKPETGKGATMHKVEAGETLASIAKHYYNSSGPKSIARIVDANHGLDADKLKVGQELTIPATSVKAAGPAQ